MTAMGQCLSNSAVVHKGGAPIHLCPCMLAGVVRSPLPCVGSMPRLPEHLSVAHLPEATPSPTSPTPVSPRRHGTASPSRRHLPALSHCRATA